MSTSMDFYAYNEGSGETIGEVRLLRRRDLSYDPKLKPQMSQHGIRNQELGQIYSLVTFIHLVKTNFYQYYYPFNPRRQLPAPT